MQFILEMVKKMEETTGCRCACIKAKAGVMAHQVDDPARGEDGWVSCAQTTYGLPRTMDVCRVRGVHMSGCSAGTLTYTTGAWLRLASALALLLKEMFALGLFFILSPSLHSVKWESHLGKVICGESLIH